MNFDATKFEWIIESHSDVCRSSMNLYSGWVRILPFSDRPIWVSSRGPVPPNPSPSAPPPLLSPPPSSSSAYSALPARSTRSFGNSLPTWRFRSTVMAE